MAEQGDGEGLLNLSLTQKLQLGAFGTGTTVFLLTYLVSAGLNGFTYVNNWIIDNPVPVLAYWSLTIGMLPVYRDVDPTQWKSLKQSIYNSIVNGAVFIPIWIYYRFNPPTTGIDRIVSKLSYIIFLYVFLSTALSYSYFTLEKDEN